MLHEFSLRVSPYEAFNREALQNHICRLKGLKAENIKGIQIVRQSVDARQKKVMMQLQVCVYENEKPPEKAYTPISYGDVSSAPAAIVVGAGPAGLFAALRLIESGYKPILVERGKKVHERKIDIATAVRTQHIQHESNYCYGEGGAGAFSDGKLHTRSKKRGNVKRILQIFCQFGAAENILQDSHPHIGTDKLPRVIANMREQILHSGGEIHFETRMTDLILQGNLVKGIRCQDGREFFGPVILATGHSARDVYFMLHEKGFPLQAKGLAMGVRLEHPQILIDQLMYHHPQGRGPWLPAAEYAFVQQVEGRGVYSFCMCPGGFVVPAGEEDGILVVNGMSPSKRSSRWANSGMVVEIRPEDYPRYRSMVQTYLQEKDLPEPAPELSMLRLQQAFERQSYQQIGKGLTAPAQRMDDFVHGRLSSDLPESSYIAGLESSPLHEWMPEEIARRLQSGFKCFEKSRKGFLSHQAVLIAAESRTSSPIRLPREEKTLTILGFEHIYPCGEGAGYAGGIVSSAIDGELCADSCIARSIQS